MKIFTIKRWLVLCAVTAGLIFAGLANASTYECRELERVSVSAGGMMQPAYPGRELVFTRDGNVIESNGVFFHPEYVMTPLGEGGFRAFAQNDDRTDIFASKMAFSFTAQLSNTVMNHRSNRRFSPARCGARNP